ncbi:hypothetical protein ACDX78_02240 [Virgibacillus oceani]
MKKVLFILFAALFVVGCSGDDEESAEVNAEEMEPMEQSEGEEVKSEQDDEFDIDEFIENAREETYEQSEEAEKEIYLNSINNLISDYDETYETFTTEAGTNFYDMVIQDIDTNGIDVARGNTDQLLDVLKPEEQEAFSEFLDELLEIEETFSHLDWSD